MTTLMTVEISLTVIISMAAIALSAYSIVIAKRRNDTTDLKEVTRLLTMFSTKIETIEGAVLGKPTLSEQVAVHAQKIDEHGRRITSLEQKA